MVNVDLDAPRRAACRESQMHQHRVADCAPIFARPDWVDWEAEVDLTAADIQAAVPHFKVCAIAKLKRGWSDFRAGTVVATGWTEPVELGEVVETVLFIPRPDKLKLKGEQ